MIGPGKWWRGRRVHKLCDRWRRSMRELGERESVWNLTDQALLLGLKELVEEGFRKNNHPATPEQIVKATIDALEISVLAAEEKLEERAHA